jgi:hypothetical protein
MPTSRMSASNSPAAAAADGLQLDDRLRRLSRPGGVHPSQSAVVLGWSRANEAAACNGRVTDARHLEREERISSFPACWAARRRRPSVWLCAANGCRRSVRRRHPRRVFRLGGQYRPRPRPLDDGHPRAKWPPRHLLSTPPSSHPPVVVRLGRCPGVGRARKAQVHGSPAERALKFQPAIPRRAAVQQTCLARSWATAWCLSALWTGAATQQSRTKA